MNTNDPMTQERLDAIRELVESMWNMDPHFLAACAHEHFPVMLAEVERLRARLIVDEDMVERAARSMSAHWHDWHTNEALGRQRALAQVALEAALGTGEGS